MKVAIPHSRGGNDPKKSVRCDVFKKILPLQWPTNQRRPEAALKLAEANLLIFY
jgi:hypothetical protein